MNRLFNGCRKTKPEIEQSVQWLISESFLQEADCGLLEHRSGGPDWC